MRYGKTCGCLFENRTESDGCLKRYFVVLIPENEEWVRLAVCNEYIRLKINEHLIKKDYGSMEIRAREVISDIIIDELNLDAHLFNNHTRWQRRGNDLFDKTIDIVTCEKPYMKAYYTMREALEHSLNGNRMIKHRTLDVIREYISTMEYVKYKSKYKTLSTIVNKIDKEFSPDELQILFTELLVAVLQINAKHKK